MSQRTAPLPSRYQRDVKEHARSHDGKDWWLRLSPCKHLTSRPTHRYPEHPRTVRCRACADEDASRGRAA